LNVDLKASLILLEEFFAESPTEELPAEESVAAIKPTVPPTELSPPIPPPPPPIPTFYRRKIPVRNRVRAYPSSSSGAVDTTAPYVNYLNPANGNDYMFINTTS